MGYEYEVGVGWVKGKRFTKTFSIIARHHRDLKYEWDYNWIFKVIDKIESLGYTFDLSSVYLQLIKNDKVFMAVISKGDRKEALYRLITQFINETLD